MKKPQHQKYAERLLQIPLQSEPGEVWLCAAPSRTLCLCVYCIMLSMLIFRPRATGPCWLPTCGPETISGAHGHGRGWPSGGGAGWPCGDEEDGSRAELQAAAGVIARHGSAGWETARTEPPFLWKSQTLIKHWIPDGVISCRLTWLKLCLSSVAASFRGRGLPGPLQRQPK